MAAWLLHEVTRFAVVLAETFVSQAHTLFASLTRVCIFLLLQHLSPLQLCYAAIASVVCTALLARSLNSI